MARLRASKADVGSLYSEHAPRVHRWVSRFVGRAEAQEVVHEIFVKVIERIDGFRAESSPTTWLYRMTVNHCLNRLRNEGRRRELWQGGMIAWATPVEPADQDTVTFLKEFWHGLEPRLVTIAFYHFVDGMTHAEIARVVGCSPRTVGNRLERLRGLAIEAAGLHEGVRDS